jgi:MYXO-CTERM domain-containing protein
MRRDVVRAVCALAVTVVAVLPATAGASSPQVEIRSGRAACGASAYCISPAALSVPSGATVLWRNLTGAPLLMSRCSLATCPGIGPGTGPDAGPPSPSLGAGSESGLTFLRPGTYNYAFVAGGIAVLSGSVSVTAVGAPASRSVAAAPAPAAPAPAAAAASSTAPLPLVSALSAPATAAAPPAPDRQVATPKTGAAPPWTFGALLTLAGAGLLGLSRRRRGRAG